MLLWRLLFSQSSLLPLEPENMASWIWGSTAGSSGCSWYGVHRPRLLLHDATGPDIAEQPDKPTACIISTPQPVFGVAIHRSSNTILTTGIGRHISILAPETHSSTIAEARAEAARAAAEQVLQQEAARQHQQQEELRADDVPMASEDGPGHFRSHHVDTIDGEP